MSTHGRHSRAEHRWLPAIVLALVVGAMVVAAGAIGWNIADNRSTEQATDGPPSTAAPTGTSSADGATSGPTPSQSTAETTLLEQCRSLWTRQVEVELAGDAALDQWRLHIDAMNQLVAGEITLAQATQYWNDTREGAHAKAEAFRAMDADLSDSAVRCEDTQGSDTPVDKCATATAAFASSLGAARIAMTSWEHHIHDMDLFRAGEITAEQATKSWLASWNTGANQLATYDRHAAHALEQDCA